MLKPILKFFPPTLYQYSDVNDNPPEFPQLWYEVVVSEGVAVGTQILEPKAMSKDSGKNAKLSYQIVKGNENRKLTINSNTGRLFKFCCRTI